MWSVYVYSEIKVSVLLSTHSYRFIYSSTVEMLIAYAYKTVPVEKINEQKILESPVNKRSEPMTKIYPNLVEPFIKNVFCLLVVLNLSLKYCPSISQNDGGR